MIGSGSGVRRIENAARLAVPHLQLLLLLLLGFVSLPLPYLGAAQPFLVLMHVFYWSIYRPLLTPPPLCFAAGIVMDILSGNPLGLDAFILVMVQWIVRGQRRFLMGQPYTTTWAVFAVILAGAGTAQWGLYGLAHFQWPPFLPVAGSIGLSLFLYPFITYIFVLTHRILPVASRMRG